MQGRFKMNKTYTDGFGTNTNTNKNKSYNNNNKSSNSKAYTKSNAYNPNIAKGTELIKDKSVYANGELAEMLVAEYFKRLGCEVTDLSKNKKAQKFDIDLGIRKGEMVKALEVKYDSYTARTKSICLEMKNLTYGVNSWFYTSGATDLVVVPQGAEQIAYMFSFKDLRKATALFDVKEQYDKYSKCNFQIGILSIKDFEDAGFKVQRLLLPPQEAIEVVDCSYSYMQEIKQLQAGFNDEEIEAMGFEVPQSLKRKGVN